MEFGFNLVKHYTLL